MKVLVALPVRHKQFSSIDDILSGKDSCSGTDGSIIRLAGFLASAGLEVSLSADSIVHSSQFKCIQHGSADTKEFDFLVVHQTHWNGAELTFGNEVIHKTCLWLQNQVHQTLIYTFLNEGGYRVICPSVYHSNVYRALPFWSDKVATIYNSFCPVFANTSSQLSYKPKPRLTFVGAITPDKGFIELTQIWSRLAQQKVDLSLAVAGSIGLHKKSTTLGATGVAESDFDSSVIQPWLQALPEEYQPKFLGALAPVQLRDEISKSWAVIVNPSYRVPETFCVSAVEAQASNRTVFSVACGALTETVYKGKFNSLAEGGRIESLCDLIIEGLSKKQLVEENGKLAGEFVRRSYSDSIVCKSWLDLLAGHTSASIAEMKQNSFRNVVCDTLRWSRTWHLANHIRDAEHRKIMSTYKKSRKSQSFTVAES